MPKEEKEEEKKGNFCGFLKGFLSLYVWIFSRFNLNLVFFKVSETQTWA